MIFACFLGLLLNTVISPLTATIDQYSVRERDCSTQDLKFLILSHDGADIGEIGGYERGYSDNRRYLGYGDLTHCDGSIDAFSTYSKSTLRGCSECSTTILTYNGPWACKRDLQWFNSYLLIDTGNNKPLITITEPVYAWLSGQASHFTTIGYIPADDANHFISIRNAEGGLVAWAIETTADNNSSATCTNRTWDLFIDSSAITSAEQQDLINPKTLFFAAAYRYYQSLPVNCQRICDRKIVGVTLGTIGGIGLIAVGLAVLHYYTKRRRYESMATGV